MAKVSTSPKDKREVHLCHLSIIDATASEVMQHQHTDLDPGMLEDVKNELAFHKLAAWFSGANWSSKLNPEPPAKQV
jgi:hypothetical protein